LDSTSCAVSHFLKEAFSSIDWTFDKRILGGCSLRRPDHFVHLGSHAITVETDENEHGAPSYTCLCEQRKMMEQFQDAGAVPHVFIRFNPDAYVDLHGQCVPGCWGSTPKTHEPCVEPQQRAQWAARLAKLKEVVQHFIDHTPNREIEVVELFYSSGTDH